MGYFDQATETLPREQLAALQLGKLQAMSKELWGRNGFYTNKWKTAGITPDDIRSLDDLARLPFTKKGELMDDQAANGPFGTNLTYPLEAYVRMHQTSGTTGVPLKVLDTTESWDWWGRCWGHVWPEPASPPPTACSWPSPSAPSSASGPPSKARAR
jgi:phenylacetate-CoA ligase